MTDILDENHTFICECSCLEHQFHIELYHDKYSTDLILYPFLNSYKPWYFRLYIAIKYILGYKTKYGVFDEVLIKLEDADKIQKLIEIYKEIKLKKDCNNVK